MRTRSGISRSNPRPDARALLLVLSLASSGCGGAGGGGGSRIESHGAPSKGRTPEIVVTIVIDQLGAWEATERLETLPADGGFARLRREGTWMRDVRYGHAVTDTAPGHASLYTGVAPSVHGIVGNERFARTGGARQEKVSALRDETTRLVLGSGVLDEPGKVASSLASLRVPTLADQLRASHPDARIVSLSLKDRGALFGGGRTPTASLWFDPSLGALVSSSALTQRLPDWAAPFDARGALLKYASRTWAPLDATWIAAHAATPDDQPGEGDFLGLGRTFPHVVPAGGNGMKALRATPFGDELVLEAAAAAIADHAKGADRAHAAPMLLALSLSSHDYVGHVFGPDAWEQWDELRRLDRGLSGLFAALDAAVGVDGWAAVLSADHGATTLPEAAENARPWCRPGAPADRFARACGPIGRLFSDALGDELQAAAEKALGAGKWVQGVADPYVYLDADGLALSGEKKVKLLDLLVATLRGHAEVESVANVEVALADCKRSPPTDADESDRALLCRSLADGPSGALYVSPKRGSFFDAGYVTGFGSSHGTRFVFDRSVPLLARGPGMARGRVDDTPARYVEFARLARAFLGL
jgi:hypothetical protein